MLDHKQKHISVKMKMKQIFVYNFNVFAQTFFILFLQFDL